MKTEENIQILENIEEQEYKPQKSLIEKMDDYKHEIERLQEEVSRLQIKTCYADEQGYTAGEREKQVQELIQTLSRKDNEILVLQLQLDDLKKEKELLKEGNEWLSQGMKELKSEFQKTKIMKEQVSNSEAALKQVNKELARENEELKLDIRTLKEELSIESKELKVPIKINIDRELNEKNCELSIVNSCLANKVRDADWAMMQVETHLQMISSILNHTREEIVV